MSKRCIIDEERSSEDMAKERKDEGREYDKIKALLPVLMHDRYGVREEIDGRSEVKYTPCVKEFMRRVQNVCLSEEEIAAASKKGAERGEAERDVVFALIKSIVDSEKYASGTVLEQFENGTITHLIKKL